MAKHLLTDAQFTKLAQLAYDSWGLELPPGKRVLIDNRITKLMRSDGFETVDALLSRATGAQGGLMSLFDVLSTNHTGFYRESGHFDCLVDEVIRPYSEGRWPGNGKLRIWSAACSNGSEPYTLGMVLHDNLPDLQRRDVKILATDLSDSALASARRAVYPKKVVGDLPRATVERHFESKEDQVAVRSHVRNLITFGVVNLVGDWKMNGPFDAIFCRNVMIYFDAPTKAKLIGRLRQLLCPGGLLFVGSSESLIGQVNGLQTVAPGAYRNIGAPR